MTFGFTTPMAKILSLRTIRSDQNNSFWRNFAHENIRSKTVIIEIFIVSIERKVRTTQIEQHQVQFVQRGVNMKINIIDTPGFGDTLDGTERLV